MKSEELPKLGIYPNLLKLRLSNNPIESLDHLRTLAAKLPNLEILDLVSCPVTKSDSDSDNKEYREAVFKMFPKLQVLDMIYQDGAIYESDSKNYKIEDLIILF